MKYNTILTLATVLVAGFHSLFAQNTCDTCYVGLRIENKNEPFVVKNDPSGKPSGVLSVGLNGDIYLYTNRPFVKIQNESSQNFRNKLTGEYRVIMFDCGHATTYDYVRQKNNGVFLFGPKSVKNFQNTIYFGGDLQECSMHFQLENNVNYRRFLQIRRMSGEFGGIDKIQVTVAGNGLADSTYTYHDNGRQDTIVLYPGQVIKRVSATRYSNGVLKSISFNEQKLAGQYTFRNSSLISESDRLAARNATLTTSDTAMALVAPGVLSLEYSFMEGDGEAQTEHKDIQIVVGVVPTEESSSTWIWWLLVLIVLGGAGGYYYRRYQMKKNGIIPETDAEKVVRLTKEVSIHESTIKNLRSVESGLLSDKDNLQKEVQKLNQALQTSKNETLEKVAESNGYHEQLNRLQQHTDEVQANLDEARRQIAVYESGEEQKEIKRLNEQIASIKEAHKQELAAADAKNQQERAKLISDNESKMNENLYECESRITAVNSAKENAVAAVLAEKENIEQRLTSAMNEAIERLTAEKETAVATLTAEKEEAIDRLTQEKEQAIMAAEADRDAKVKEAEMNRDAKVRAAENERDSQVAAALAEKEAIVNRLIIEKDDAISAAISEKEQAIGKALTEKDEAIAAAVAEKNIAVTAANEERDRAVLAAETEKENMISAMNIRQTEELSRERAKTAEAVSVIKQSTTEYIAYIERSVDAIVLQITNMQQAVEESRFENNYTNVISHLSQKVLDFDRWFKREISEGQKEHTWSVKDVQQLLQEQLLPLLGNNYTWVSEMVRFTAYCGISRQFKDQFLRSGVPTDYLRNAYAETVTLFGRMGITLLVPSLFADDYNPECHKLNNAPLINSFFPHTFMEYRPESKGMIYDVLRPGYSLEGEVKQLPEVCVY